MGMDSVAKNGSDGGRAHLVLSREDLRRVVAGREALSDVLVEIVNAPLEISGIMAEGFEDANAEGEPDVMHTKDERGPAP